MIADLFHNGATAWAVLALSLVVTVFAWHIADRHAEERARERFAFEVAEASQRIAGRLAEHEQVLRGAVMPTGTAEGFVESPLDIDHLMRGLPGSETPGLGFELYDATTGQSTAPLLYASHPDAAHTPKYRETITIALPGRTWNGQFHSRPAFDAAVATSEPALVAVGGATVGVLVFSIIIIRSRVGEHRRGRSRAEMEHTRAEERLRLAASVFDHAHEGIAITDAQECIVEVNPTFTELTGFTREEVIGKTPRILKSGRHDAEFYAELWRTLKGKGHWHGEIWNRRKSGELYPELLTLSAVRGPGDEITHYVGIFSDITLLKEHQHRLERMAHYDALTQLPNRVLLADRMQQAMARARRRGRLLAVCYLDLDGFKPINDQYGHDVGDQLLIQVAERLNGTLRESDSAARLGGDEFVLLLNDLRDVRECKRGIERVLRAMAAHYELGSHRVTVSASVGVTLFPDDDSDADTLLRHADQAMYQAKQAGRNRYWLFDPEHDRLARAQREAVTRIETALNRGEFRLHYQPKVDMRTGEVVGVEALIRWQHPERGLLLPAEFLPVLDGSEFARSLGEWVLREALVQLAEWNRQGLKLTISVNIAGSHLQQPDFARRLGELLARHPEISATQLELEVLETTALEDIAMVSHVIEQCRALGVGVALDDFGTGYSSLTYLKRLPADTLKIDRSFIRDMLNDPEDLTIIEGIVGLTQAFRRRVIAEGVESEEHGALLLRLGCDLAQGFGIAQPMPAEDVSGWIEGYRQPPAWRAAARIYWPHEDLPLLSAELEHRRWVDDLIASLDSGSHIVPTPPMEVGQCRFGQWYAHHGKAHYGGAPAYVAVQPIHEAIHRVARDLLDLERSGKSAEAQRRVPELLKLRAEIITQLHALQAMVAEGHSGCGAAAGGAGH